MILSWNVTTGAKLGEFVGHTDLVSCLQVKNELLYSTSDDETVRIWNKDFRNLIEIFQGDDMPKTPDL